AALLIVSCLAVLCLGLGGWWYNVRLKDALQIAEQRRLEAQANEEEAHLQQKRAEVNFAKARQAVDKLLTRVVEGRLAPLRNMESVRLQSLQDALTFYQDFLQEKKPDPEIRQEAARAYRRIADVKRLLKNYKDGEKAYQAAISLDDDLVKEFPSTAAYRQDLA